MNRAADLLARRLHEAGCRYAFGMPGGEVLTVVDALVKAGIEFILCKHENNAGFMAEGVHHRTGVPGILVATIGPGVANAVNVVANAQQDRVPLIILTGCVDADEALTFTHQVFDHRALFAPITKATFTLSANAADLIADKALAIALRDRSGPVLIDVPTMVAETIVERPLRSRDIPASPTAPAEVEALSKAREWLAEAERPLLIAGLDVMKHHASETLRNFIQSYEIPVITTYKAKGVIPEDHPLALGPVGLSPLADTIIQPLLKEADLLLCVGYDPVEMRSGWRDAFHPAQQRIVEITAEANTHFMHHASISFVCDVKAGIESLSSGVRARKTWAHTRASEIRAAHKAAFASRGTWGPAQIVEIVRKVFPRNTLATADSGAHRILMSHVWEAYDERTVLQSSGLCTMGCALPLAVGAKIADPETPVVAFTGDAGLLMILGELSTLAELALPITIVVFVDASLTLIEMKQRQRQLPNAGVDFGHHDFAAIAQAFGGAGETVSDAVSLERALNNALMRTRQFTVIAAEIDRGAYDGRI